jgi:hypothetical protein
MKMRDIISKRLITFTVKGIHDENVQSQLVKRTVLRFLFLNGYFSAYCLNPPCSRLFWLDIVLKIANTWKIGCSFMVLGLGPVFTIPALK